MKIKDLLSPRAIRLNAPAESKSQAIDALVELHAAAGNLTDPSAYKAAILAREGQGTTAIGEGIAVRIVLRRYLLEARYGLVVVVFRYALFFVEPDDAFGFGLYLFVFRFGSRQLQGIVARIHPGNRFSFAYLLSDGDGNLRNRPADTESEVRLGRCLQFARKTDASFPFASGRFGQFDGSDNLFWEASVPASGQQNRQHQQQDGALFHIFHLLSA